MAIDCLTAPVRAGDDFMVGLLAQFTGNGSSAPSNVRGKSVTVERTGTGTYRITFPTTLTLANLRGVDLTILQAAGTNYTLTATITSGKLVITAKDPEDVTPFTAVDLASTEQVLVTAWVRDSSQ